MKKPRKGTTLAELIADIQSQPSANQHIIAAYEKLPGYSPEAPKRGGQSWIFPEGEFPVSMVTYRGYVLVATNIRVYMIRDFVLIPLMSITNAD